MSTSLHKRIETLVWVLIFGGLLCAMVGWFVARSAGPWGELMLTGGVGAVVAGVALIFLRARMKE